MPSVKKTATAQKATAKKAVLGAVVKVYDLNGKEGKTVELPKEIFKTNVNPKLLAQYVRVYLANQRQGTASAKTRGDVVGSTRKIYRQKGTGKARHGDIKAPIFVGGGVVGGPRPRDYSLKINKKQSTKALLCALSLKQKENNIVGLEDNALKTKPKTKIIAGFFKNTNISETGSLLILPKMEKNNLVLAARNIAGLDLVEALSLNAFEVLRAKKLIFVEKALEVLKKHLIKNEN